MHTNAPSHAHMNVNRHVNMFKKIKSMAEGQTWWHKPAIPAFMKEEDIVDDQPELHSDTLFQTNK